MISSLRIFPFLAAGLLSGLLAGGVLLQSNGGSGALASKAEPGPLASAPPEGISIPSLGIEARIVPVGLTAEGNMGTSENERDVAWYSSGTIPGMPGNAVLAGHLDTMISPRAVFYDLENIRPGAMIHIRDAQGVRSSFRVLEKRLYEYSDPAAGVFSPSKKARLNLVTCAGEWLEDLALYSHRLVVTAEKVR